MNPRRSSEQKITPPFTKCHSQKRYRQRFDFEVVLPCDCCYESEHPSHPIPLPLCLHLTAKPSLSVRVSIQPLLPTSKIERSLCSEACEFQDSQDEINHPSPSGKVEAGKMLLPEIYEQSFVHNQFHFRCVKTMKQVKIPK